MEQQQQMRQRQIQRQHNKQQRQRQPEQRKRISPLYRVIRFLVWLFYPKTRVEGAEHLPEQPCVVVGNHSQIHGPVACELYFPGKHQTWCVGEMMHLKEVPDYAFQDFWSEKPRGIRWFFRLLSFLIAPLSVCVFNNANCIGVYRDGRVLSTFRESVAKLSEGNNIIIFPERHIPGNGILWQFQEGFVDLARLWYKKTGQELDFVPLYVAPRLKTLYLGTPVRWNAAAPREEERRRIVRALTDEITRMARSLPPHTVVPYPNMPKKDYPSNRDALPRNIRRACEIPCVKRGEFSCPREPLR